MPGILELLIIAALLAILLGVVRGIAGASGEVTGTSCGCGSCGCGRSRVTEEVDDEAEDSEHSREDDDGGSPRGGSK